MSSLNFFDCFPELGTRRLLLRAIRESDAPEIHGMRASQRVNQFIARPAMISEEDALALIRRTQEAFEKQQGIGWPGVLRTTGKLIGTCGFNSIDPVNRRAEMGGEMATDYWGKHLAVEAVERIVRFGFEEMDLHSIESKTAPDNRGAICLLESLGFVKEAHFKDRIWFDGKFRDLAVYSVVRKKS